MTWQDERRSEAEIDLDQPWLAMVSQRDAPLHQGAGYALNCFKTSQREKRHGDLYLGPHPSAHARSGSDRAMVRAHVRRAGDPQYAIGQAAHRHQARRRQHLPRAGYRRRRRQWRAHDAYQGLDHFGLAVSGIDAIAADLKKKGVEFTKEPHSPRPGIKICFLRGPQGISIELLDRDPKYS